MNTKQTKEADIRGDAVDVGENTCHSRLNPVEDKSFNPAATNLVFDNKVICICRDIGKMLINKNKSYGNAALDPLRIFSKADGVEQLLVRIDDKLSRIKRGNNFGEDVIKDLIGYLILLKIAKE
jgi:hypothetical protein